MAPTPIRSSRAQRGIWEGAIASASLSNAQEAIEAFLESLKAYDEPIPPPIEEVVVEAAV